MLSSWANLTMIFARNLSGGFSIGWAKTAFAHPIEKPLLM